MMILQVLIVIANHVSKGHHMPTSQPEMILAAAGKANVVPVVGSPPGMGLLCSNEALGSPFV